MPFLRPHRLVLGLIALVAIAWAQAFGLHRGFVCDCGGVEFVTQVDHCHGPHSTACHDTEDLDHAVSHQHEEDDGDTHQHAAVVDSLIAKEQGDFSFSIAAPVKVLDALDLWVGCFGVPFAVHGQHAPVATPLSRAGPAQAQAWPRLLAQTIVLRI